MLADTHAHLADSAFAGDVAQVVERARANGVSRILSVGTNLETSRACIALADQFDEVYAAVGIHPSDVASFTPESVTVLRELGTSPKVVAIGEIGLDYYWTTQTKDAQIVAFESQLGLAADLGLPVVVHHREATDDVLACIERSPLPVTQPDRAGVLHSFTGTVATAERARVMGLFVSFAGMVTFRTAAELRATASKIPLDRILVETDSPFLAPVPVRGRRNEPANVRFVAECLAESKQESADAVAEQTSTNAARLFQWR